MISMNISPFYDGTYPRATFAFCKVKQQKNTWLSAHKDFCLFLWSILSKIKMLRKKMHVCFKVMYRTQPCFLVGCFFVALFLPWTLDLGKSQWLRSMWGLLRSPFSSYAASVWQALDVLARHWSDTLASCGGDTKNDLTTRVKNQRVCMKINEYCIYIYNHIFAYMYNNNVVLILF